MNQPRATREDYVQFVLATHRYSSTEAARVTPDSPDRPVPPSHDAFTRLLNHSPIDTQELWDEARPMIHRQSGILVIDDSTLDKPYARHMNLVGYHWSGKHRAVVKGINLQTLLWTDGDRLVPCDFRVADPLQGSTKNDQFRDLLRQAKNRGFQPKCVAFDSWYSGRENLKLVQELGWVFLTQFKCNRKVSIDHQPKRAITEWEIAATGTNVHLEGFGLIRVFRVVTKNGNVEHWATNDLTMDELTRLKWAEMSWDIEVYHRGIKQHLGVERCQSRFGRAQKGHIGMVLQAFVRLEWHRFRSGISWLEAKLQIIRGAVRAYLANPHMPRPQREYA